MPGLHRNRFALLVAGVVVFSGAIVARLVNLQVVKADVLRARAARQHRQVIEVIGRRGAIVDREGRELAVSVMTRSLFAHPPRVKDPAGVAKRLAPVLQMREAEILALLRRDDPFVWIKRFLDPAVAREIEGMRLDPDGKAFGFQDEAGRRYPQDSLAVHVVGSTNIDQNGIEGIEKRFDDVLREENTRYLAVVDAKGGTTMLEALHFPKKRSRDVVLALDLVVQHTAERELDRAMEESGARAGTAVVLDPSTGHVLALANRPTIRPGSAAAADSETRRNRAVTYLYEPGSTFKAFTASAALDQGRVSPDTVFNCAPYLLAGHLYKDSHPHGSLTVREIIEESSNVGIQKVGRTLARETFRDYIVRFGFGQRTGIELPGERSGNVTSLARMTEQSPVSMAMGYELQVTPLQIASAIGAIANGGRLVPPRIVLGTRGDDGSFEAAPEPESRQTVSPATAATMVAMLEGVVLRGTGKRAAVPGYRVAGKTGTSHIARMGGGYENLYYSSFVGFGPLGSPRVLAMVMLEAPTRGDYYGGLVAAPVVGRILAEAFTYLGVPPDDDPWRSREDLVRQRAAARPRATPKSPPAAEPDPDAPIATGPGQVPDLRGKSLREASVALASLGCRVQVDGEGVVRDQAPPPGAPVPDGGLCSLTMAAPERPKPDPALVAAVVPAALHVDRHPAPAKRAAPARRARGRR